MERNGKKNGEGERGEKREKGNKNKSVFCADQCGVGGGSFCFGAALGRELRGKKGGEKKGEKKGKNGGKKKRKEGGGGKGGKERRREKNPTTVIKRRFLRGSVWGSEGSRQLWVRGRRGRSAAAMAPHLCAPWGGRGVTAWGGLGGSAPISAPRGRSAAVIYGGERRSYVFSVIQLLFN